MFAQALAVLWFVSTAAGATLTPPTTSCVTVGSPKHPRSRTISLLRSCTNTIIIPSSIIATPVSTSIVYSTSTSTAAGSTSTATDTSTLTETDTTTILNTATQITTVTQTELTTFSYITGVPQKRAAVTPVQDEIGARNVARSKYKSTGTITTPTAGVYCTVARCVRQRSTSTIVSTQTTSTSTATSTSTITTTVTPNASVTITVTTTSTFLITVVSGTTTITQTSTTNVFSTIFPTPTFYLLSSESNEVPNGYQVVDYGIGTFIASNGDLFTIDPLTGIITDVTTGDIAYGQIFGGSSGEVTGFYFADPVEAGLSGTLFQCSIDPTTNYLDCNCGGLTYWNEAGFEFGIANQPARVFGLSPEQPVASIIAQSV